MTRTVELSPKVDFQLGGGYQNDPLCARHKSEAKWAFADWFFLRMLPFAKGYMRD